MGPATTPVAGPIGVSPVVPEAMAPGPVPANRWATAAPGGDDGAMTQVRDAMLMGR